MNAILGGAGGALTPTRLVEHAHAAGLQVHAWTFRAENMFLPVSFRRGTELAGHGDLAGEIRLHVQNGVDGLFCDFPDVARAVCVRTASAAVLEGSIAALGSQYVLGLHATNCATGEILADEQAQAARKEDVLSTLSEMATRFRTRV